MKPGLFLKDKGGLLLLHLVCMGLLWLYLHLTGYSGAYAVLILIFWVLILAGWLCVNFWQRKRFFGEARQILQQMDQRYLLGELLPDSFRLEDQLYREMICSSNKSVIERIRQIEEEQREYREYIENWVHEIKAPIANISLICDNRRKGLAGAREYLEQSSGNCDLDPEGLAKMGTAGATDAAADFAAISLENGKIENSVDMVLYHARSREVYKDYLIRETSLEEVVWEVLARNRLLLITEHVQVEVDCRETVYTDRKWIAFILNQLLLNSVKYRSQTPVFRIGTRKGENGVTLVFSDNGTGIREEELSRIFEKGFTGSNGRERSRATGMGLYLCRKLCDRLGIGIRARSRYGEGTEILLEFPISRHII